MIIRGMPLRGPFRAPKSLGTMHQRLCLRLSVLLAAVLGLSSADAQGGAGGGTIEGRVLNVARGDYLNNAHLVVKGTAIEAFTDSLGQYWLSGVPAGTANVTVFYTGLASRELSVAVVAGKTVRLDVELTPAKGTSVGDEKAVTLEAVVVSTTKETDGAAIAINEKRFAPNLMNVVAAEEFGLLPEGNIGTFLSFLPGVTIETASGDPGGVQLMGVPAVYTTITVGGFDLANASASSTSRRSQLDLASVNNLSRVEVVQSPTPESPGNALAGTINLVPKTAFERSRPSFSYNAFLMGRTHALDFTPTPGPRPGAQRKITPGADFSYIMPVNRNFGFTLSGATTNRYTAQTWADLNWAGTFFALAGTSAANPALTDYWLTDSPNFVSRSSLAASADFRLGRADVFTVSFQYAYFEAYQIIRQIEFGAGQQQMPGGNFSPLFTHGNVGMGSVRLNVSGNGSNPSSQNYTPTVTWRHTGPVWRTEAGAAYSLATNRYRDIDYGFFQNIQARRGLTPGAAPTTAGNFAGGRITVNFDEIGAKGPRTITVLDDAGRALDPADPSIYRLTGATDRVADSQDERVSAYANARRSFAWRVPVAVKGGLDFRNQRRDIARNNTRSWTFVGPDGLANTADDDVRNYPSLYDEEFSRRAAPYWGHHVTYLSNYKAWDLYQAHPAYFTTNDATNLTSALNNTRLVSEAISAAYLRADLGFFEQRLRVVTGVRAEQTNVEGAGVRFDPTLNFTRDAAGNVVNGSNGRPLPRFATNSLDYVKTTRLARGAIVKKEYLELHPSINLSYAVTPNLTARAAYYRSIGRPDFGQYVSGLSLPDLSLGPTSTNVITANNPNIKPWIGLTQTASLEYYVGKVGLLSVTVYQRDIDGFIISGRATAVPAFLDAWALSDDYAAYEVATQRNSESALRFRGGQAAYKQSLTFLPSWARGVNVFGNVSWQRAEGDEAQTVVRNGQFVPLTGSWGVALGRERYNVRMNWNYRGRTRQNARANGAWQYQQRRLYIDLDADYYLTRSRQLGLFFNARNLRDQGDNEIETMSADTPSNARLRETRAYGVLLTLGVRGNF
jgi:iron complex outermembrane recepter protein